MTNRRISPILSFLIAFALLSGRAPLVQAAGGDDPAPQAPANLAWFYKPPADGNLNLVAENYSTYILTKGDELERDRLIGLGVTAPILQYLRFDAIMDPGSCTAKPYRNNVAYLPGDFCTISVEHPDWFLLDTAGQRIAHLSDTAIPYLYYHMDPGNPGWRAFFLERVRQVHASDPVWAGVFLDNVEVSLYKYTRAGESLAAYPDNAGFEIAVQGFLKYLRENYFQPQGKLMYANLVACTDDGLFTSYMTYLDGAMNESWGVTGANSRWRSAYTWERHLQMVEQAQAMGKPLILVSQGEQDDQELQQFAYASYLLVSDGATSFRYAGYDAYHQAWLYENYQAPLGTPLGARYKDGAEWKRDFSNGSVSVDPIAHLVSITPTDTTAAAVEPPFRVFLPFMQK